MLTAWAETLRRHADSPAVYETSGAVARSFTDIQTEAEQLAAGELAGFAAGSVVAIQTGNHVSWPALVLACLQRRLIVLPLESTMGERDRSAALSTCRVSAVVTAACGKLETEVRRDVLPISWAGPAPALLKLTSGTTAAPRAIRFRSEQLLADGVQICDTMGIGRDDVNFAVVPISHSYGFSNMLTPLLSRGVPMVLSRDRIPRAMLDDLARTKATVFPGMPVFFQAFAEMTDVPALPALRLCVSAGAPLPIETARKFREKFGRPIHSFYGASECGGICYDRDARLEEPGFVGAAMSGIHLEVLEPGAASSRVRVHSAAVGDGYFPENDVEQLSPGAFTPDDLLAESGGGWRIVGRVSDVINVAGKKVNPADVEAELLAFRHVRAAVAFARGSATRNEEVAACVVSSDPGLTEPLLLAHCRLRLSGWQVPKRIYFVAQIPLSERGKINRRALAEMFAREPIPPGNSPETPRSGAFSE